MDDVINIITPILQELAKEKEIVISEEDIKTMLVTQKPTELRIADIAVPLFSFASLLKQAPDLIAKGIVACIDIKKHPEFERVESKNGYANFFLSRNRYARKVLHDIHTQWSLFGSSQQFSMLPIVVEFSSPNSNKPLHLGHLRNNILGESISRILSYMGAQIIKTNLINDRGIHICQAMAAYKEFAHNQTPERLNQKGDFFVGKYYSLFLQWARKDQNAEREARKLLQDWEKGEEEVKQLWKMLTQWVIRGHQSTYRRTNILFHVIDYESQMYMKGKDIALQGEKANIFFRGNENELLVDLSSIGLDQKVLLRSDGTSLYITQDIGTAVSRNRRWDFHQMIYVVAYEQNYHFKVLFEILKRLGYSWAHQLRHLSYGMVHLPEGRLKSREGRTVDADTLLDSLTQMAQDEIKLRQQHVSTDSHIAESVALAALHYYLLRPHPATDITFNPDASLEFQGDTGPYIQYMVARVYSLAGKYKQTYGKVFMPSKYRYNVQDVCDDEWTLIMHLGDFPRVVVDAGKGLNPSLIAEYAHRLAKKFSQYYNKHIIIDPQQENRSTQRMFLAYGVRRVLENCMYLLNLPVLETM